MTNNTPVHPFSLMQTLDNLTDEQKQIQEATREFTSKEIKPYISSWFENESTPVRDLAKKLGSLGLLGAHLQGYGCAGVDALSYGLACMELEAADSAIRSLVSVQGSLAMYAIYKFGSELQKQSYLPSMAAGDTIGCFGLTESESGSDPKSMRTTAKKDKDGWILNGSKMWITNATVADVAIIWARTENGIAGFILPTSTPGFAAYKIEHKLSLRASLTGEIKLENVHLPESARLPQATSLAAPLSCLNQARFGILFGAIGAARDCYEQASSYAQTRLQFGSPISSFQLTQAKLAQMATDLNTSLLLALHIGSIKNHAEPTPAQISMGKYHNVSSSLQIARECRTIMGAAGITSDYSILRHMNNLESVLTYEGTHEMHTLILGQALTGIPSFK